MNTFVDYLLKYLVATCLIILAIFIEGLPYPSPVLQLTGYVVASVGACGLVWTSFKLLK